MFHVSTGADSTGTALSAAGEAEGSEHPSARSSISLDSAIPDAGARGESGLFGEDGLVGLRRHEARQLAAIRDPDAEEPALSVRVLVHGVLAPLDGPVDLDDLAAHWGVHVAHRLHRLDLGDRGPGIDLGTDGGRLV